MRDFTSDELSGYTSRTLISRNLVFIQAGDRGGGSPQDFGFWNGTGDVSLEVLDGLTQDITTRDFTARGALLGIGDITLSDSLNVGSVVVTLSPLNVDVESAARTYDLRQAPIQIYRGLFAQANPRVLVAPARCRFAGFINTAPISEPQSGGAAALTLNCVGCTRELTRVNTDLRSDESQQRRASGDRFFRWVGPTGQIQVTWGASKSP